MNTVQYFEPNLVGRDFVVGDIHGEYQVLMEGLRDVNFNEEHDRLFCVGDLVDRGPESLKCVTELLQQPWFFTVLGNHEELFLLSQWHIPRNEIMQHEKAREILTSRRIQLGNGGAWTQLLTENEIHDVSNALSTLPLLIQIDHKSGKKYGIVHADLPDTFHGCDWNEVVADVQAGPASNSLNDIRTILLWSRSTVQNGTFFPDIKVDNIDTVFLGHTIVGSPKKIGNMHFIDAGSFKTKKLNIIELGN